MKRYMNVPISTPPCYTCVHALPRGNFRECSAGGTGYKHTDMIVECDKYQEERDEEE